MARSAASATVRKRPASADTVWVVTHDYQGCPVPGLDRKIEALGVFASRSRAEAHAQEAMLKEEKGRDIAKEDRDSFPEDQDGSPELTYIQGDREGQHVVLVTGREQKAHQTRFTLSIDDFESVNDEVGFEPIHQWTVSQEKAPSVGKRSRTSEQQSSQVWVVTHWAARKYPVPFGCCAGNVTCAGVFSCEADAEDFVRKARMREENGDFKKICSELRTGETDQPAKMQARHVKQDPTTTIFFLEVANLEEIDDEPWEGPHHEWIVSSHAMED